MEEVPSFAADRMLVRLARWLRLIGADVLTRPDIGGAELLKIARAERRILLTRDKRLRTAPDVIYLQSDRFRDQLREVLERTHFDPRRSPFTRCSYCNRRLIDVPREAIARRVPPFVFASQQRFAECEGCGRIYWAATHPERIFREIRAIGF